MIGIICGFLNIGSVVSDFLSVTKQILLVVVFQVNDATFTGVDTAVDSVVMNFTVGSHGKFWRYPDETAVVVVR